MEAYDILIRQIIQAILDLWRKSAQTPEVRNKYIYELPL